MSRYFSRLAARATAGVAPASSIPGLQRQASADTLHDPFEAMAPLDPTLSTPAFPQRLPEASLAPSLMTPPDVASQAPPLVRRVAPVQTTETSPAVPQTIALPVPRPALSQPAAERGDVLAVTSPMQTLRPPMAHEPVQVSPLVLPPTVPHVMARTAHNEEPPPRGPERRVKSYAAPERMAPPPPVLGRETTQRLEPPQPEPGVAMAPTPESPRLVIGRLRVEVVPAPPAPAAPRIVRVVEPRRSATSHTATPSTQLRFGLGQM
jgi:hypothetical protein